MAIFTTPIIIGGLILAGIAALSKPPRSSKSNVPVPDPEGPEIYFDENYAWTIDEPEWWYIAEEDLEEMLPKMGEPDFEGAEVDPTVLAWALLRHHVPDDIPFPDQPFAPDGNFWQANVPNAENYWAPLDDEGNPDDNPDSVLGLIEHVAASIGPAIPNWQATGEMVLVEEEPGQG
jgi:hypothetical protein